LGIASRGWRAAGPWVPGPQDQAIAGCMLRSRSVDGNETWLTRVFAAAIARRSLRGVAVEVVRAENDFERATTADQMW
jgi:hypothetical protein